MLNIPVQIVYNDPSSWIIKIEYSNLSEYPSYIKEGQVNPYYVHNYVIAIYNIILFFLCRNEIE